MEASLQALLDSDIEFYTLKVRKAINEIHKRYEDLGLEIDPDSALSENSEIIRYFLEEDMVVVFKIENDYHIDESRIETLAGIKRVVGKNFTAFLQKSLFQMPLERITAAIQLVLDEALFISQGHSLKKAYELAIQVNSDNLLSVTNKREVSKHLDQKESVVNAEKKIDDPKAQEAEEIIPAVKTPKMSIPQTEKPKKNRKKQGGGRRKKKQGPTKPDKEILEALLINYEGDLEAMTENPNIQTDLETLQSWIDEEGLYEFIEHLKGARPTN